MTPHSFYLAGPMTGIPQFNFPVFDRAAAELRDQGYEIVSPAELDDPATREAALASPDGAPGSGSADGETYGTFLARDVKLVIDDVDGVVTLPNWWKSRGARIEVFTAATMGKPIYYFNPDEDVNLGEPFRFSELAEHLKPGDPGNGEQHRTPAEAAGPPIPSDMEANEEPYKATREPGHIHEEMRRDEWVAAIAKGLKEASKSAPGGATQIQLPEDAPISANQVFGIPVLVTRFVDPGQVTIITGVTEPVHVSVADLVRMEKQRKEQQAEEFLSRSGVTPPGGEERITDPETGGAKGRKPVRMDLIPWEPVWEVARVYGFGDEKYPPDETGPNYLKGFDWSLSFGAAMRHLTQWASGEDHDPEFGTHHLAHVAWHCFALMMFQWHGRGHDDRLTTLTGLLPVDPAQRTARSEAARA